MIDNLPGTLFLQKNMFKKIRTLEDKEGSWVLPIIPSLNFFKTYMKASVVQDHVSGVSVKQTRPVKQGSISSSGWAMGISKIES